MVGLELEEAWIEWEVEPGFGLLRLELEWENVRLERVRAKKGV